ncbi:MAG: hypothetical protein ACKOA2_02165 [Ilumatobacteraceae bacterium]
MNDRLRDLYGHVSVHATADLEHEAALELLLLVMMVDDHISGEELDEIRRITDESGWESSTWSFDQYLGQASAKVRGAVTDAEIDALLDDIVGRLTNGVLRQALLGAIRDVADADESVVPAEDSLLARIERRLTRD